MILNMLNILISQAIMQIASVAIKTRGIRLNCCRKMASISSYPCFCSVNGLSRFTSKSGQGYVKCAEGSCSLFCPEQKYTELYSIYEKSVAKKYKPNNFPLCDCGEVAALWISHSSSNFERPFFRCKDIADSIKCNFFKWTDTSPIIKKKRGSKKRPMKNEKSKSVKRVKIESSDDEANEENQ